MQLLHIRDPSPSSRRFASESSRVPFRVLVCTYRSRRYSLFTACIASETVNMPSVSSQLLQETVSVKSSVSYAQCDTHKCFAFFQNLTTSFARISEGMSISRPQCTTNLNVHDIWFFYRGRLRIRRRRLDLRHCERRSRGCSMPARLVLQW